MFNIFRSKETKQKIYEADLAQRLEADKQQLIADLENKGMEFLVTKMSSNEEYSPLVLERRKIDLSYGSEDSASWYAYKQSDKLHSDKDKSTLLALLENEKFLEYNKYIYCCLACICANTNNKDLFNFLVEKVQQEDDESTRISILSRLQVVKKGEGYNIEPLKGFVKDGTQGETRAALRALSNSTDVEVEDIFLEEFKFSDRHMKAAICGPLSTVGTLKSIPVLQQAYKNTRDRGLKMCIEGAISTIEKRANSSSQV
ncbi:MAG: HEAT repeat domain-containing protein [Agriterribacter sp.]